MNDKMHPSKEKSASALLALPDGPSQLNVMRATEFSALEQIRHHVEISSAAAQLAALAPDVLARTKAVEEMLSPNRTAAMYLQELSNRRALKLTADRAGKLVDVRLNAIRATELSALEHARHQLKTASIAAQLAALAPDVLARTQAIEQMMSPSKTAAKYLQELSNSSALKLTADRASKLVDVHLNAVRATELSALEQIRHHVKTASVAAQLAAFPPDVLARTQAIEEILSPSKTAAKYLQELSDGRALRLATEQALRWNAPYKELAGALERFKEPLSVSSARELLESMAKSSELFEVGRLLEDGAQLPELEAVRDEVVHLMMGVTEDISEALTRREAVNLIIQAIQANQEPLLQKLLFLVLMPVLIGIVFAVVNPFADFYVKRWLEGAPKQVAIKQMKDAAREAVGDIRLLHDFRFVSVQSLSLMSGPKAKSPIVAKLQFGQVVRVLEKTRDFTLVVWRSEDGKVELHGWVFSRYLKRFN